MKTLVLAATLFTSAFAFANSANKQVTLTGLQAKAVYDTLSNAESLKDFNDAIMGGHLLFTADEINCIKESSPVVDMAQCTFKSKLFDGKQLNVTMSSDQGLLGTIEEIRYVLAQATNSEVQTSKTRKELNLNGIHCETSGHYHTTDDVSIELTYKCVIGL